MCWSVIILTFLWGVMACYKSSGVRSQRYTSLAMSIGDGAKRLYSGMIANVHMRGSCHEGEEDLCMI